MQRTALLLSVRPRYAERILEGQKTVELRRVRPRACEDAILLIYVSSPIRALKAMSLVERVTAAEPTELWKRVAHKAGVSRAEFDAYFNDVDMGFAIHLKNVLQLSQPLSLTDLRELWPGFQPPQCYRYFSGNELSVLIDILDNVKLRYRAAG
jgi:predicted transcriptional regulator